MKHLLPTLTFAALTAATFAAEFSASLTATRKDLATAHAVLSWDSLAGLSGETLVVQRQQELRRHPVRRALGGRVVPSRPSS